MDELSAAAEQAERNTANHEQEAFSGLENARVALNGNSEGFRSLERVDVAHEEQETRNLLFAWTNPDGTYKYPPQQWAMYISNHVLSLERWSNHFSIFITIMGVASAVFTLKIEKQPELFVTTVVFTLVAAVIKWNIDKQIVLKKKTINRLNSFPPNQSLQPTSGRDAASRG